MSISAGNFDTKKIDKVNLGLGLFVFFFSFIIYLMTVQRTFSFWDCGEFVACSYILGVPHPPGTPLFILIGRIFSLLPIASDIGFRINILSVVSTAMASMFGYFVIVKLVRDWFGDPIEGIRKVGIYAGAVIGALLMAFSTTNWNSAVEAEVYGLSMLMITMLIWLTLIWSDKRGTPEATKYLVLIFFLAVLSTAVHLTVYLIMPFIVLMMLLLDESLRKNWVFLITALVLLWPVKSLVEFMYIGAAWAAIVTLLFLFIHNRRLTTLPFLIMIASGIAFSSQFYIPVRAAEKPAINENAPATWKSFEDFLERKQYGQMSMVDRMFTRRGSWANQFGTHPRMGFWGFFQDQYGLSGAKFLMFLFPLGLLGLLEPIMRRWQKGLPFFLMVFAATAGLVIYMNFADGTLPNVIPGDDAGLEVRDRDYFWQPGFILFGMAIGMGVIVIWDWVYSFLSKRGMEKLTYALLAFLILPVNAIRASYHENDRSNNYISYDYAYNLLMSADSNAVVFTNGDNDTFPVWALQEVYGVRKDVRIANLSLLNTDWYIKQLKNEMGVPISLTDAQIEALRHGRYPDGRIYRVQDQLIDNIIETSRFQTPIHFAVTVSQDNRLFRMNSIEDHLEMKGMMFRLKRETGDNMIDVEATRDLYTNVFKYRGVADSSVYKDENAARLTNNYSAGFLYTAEEMRKRGDMQGAIEMVNLSIKVVPGEWRSYAYLMQIYADMDSLGKVEELLQTAPPEVDPQSMWQTLASDMIRRGQKDRAVKMLTERLAEDPHFEGAYKQLLSIYFKDTLVDSMESLLNRWIAQNPSDTEAIGAMQDVQALKETTTGVRLRKLEVPDTSK
ncbi:MAG: DUF2723 domain-containing protein [Candidatus Zixiibacteriota bacterium]